MKTKYSMQLFFIFLMLHTHILAHAVKPAYLEIIFDKKQHQSYYYKTKWRVPLANMQNSNIFPLFPSVCKEHISYQYHNTKRIFISSTLICKESLEGKNIAIKNIQKEKRNVIFYFSHKNITFFKEFNSKTTSIAIPIQKYFSQKSTNYILLGIEHILMGYDHLLFVLGLLLLVRKPKMLFATITAFTLAHSITLAASSLHYIEISSLFIEAIIALSIIILAVEIVYMHYSRYGFSAKHPWIVAILFGLIHGFGFANVLSKLGLPENHLLKSLLLFNIGIELGQIFFISLLGILYFVLKTFIKKRYLIQGRLFVAYMLGITASFWFVERISCLFY